MALAVSVIVNQARFTMLDPNPPPTGGNPTFSDVEMIGYVAEAQASVCQIKPDAFSVSVAIPLVAGSIQALPIAGNSGSLAVGTQLLDLYSNVSDGSTVRMIDREALDHSHPKWQGGTQRKLVRRWFYDARIPKQFMVAPPNDSSGVLNARYAAVPPRPAALTDALSIDDTYEGALHAYVVALCYAKNTARYDATKAGAYMAQFSAMVTGRTQPQTEMKPTEAQ